MQIEAVGERIIAKRVEEKEVEKGGIFLPDEAIEKPQVATIIAVGQGRIHPVDGSIVPLSMKVGDQILLPKFGITEVKIENEEYVICKEDDILAKLKENQ